MQEAVSSYNYLKLISFINFDLWDTKRYTSKNIASSFDIVDLGSCIKEENKKYKLFEEEEKEFGILGVNNKEGIFDAYTQKGKDINQAYKKMEVGWLAYNPYRINVGSIGIRLKEHKNEFISPAYVVFSCKENLLPEYLYLVFKTQTFNKVINESTTGSVRQNLTIDILKKLKIPLPTLRCQQKIVDGFETKIKTAQNLQIQIIELENGIEKYLFEALGYKVKSNSKAEAIGKILKLIDYNRLDKWGIDQNNSIKLELTKAYRVEKISALCKVSSGGTPSRDRKEYYNGRIPWIKTGEVVNDVIYDTEEKITEEAIANSSAKLYPKGSLIIAMYGQGLTRGRTAKLGINASTNQACAVLSEIDNSKVLTDFLWIYLQGEYHRLRELASGNNQPNLNAQMIKDYNIVIPPIAEQQRIISTIFAKRNEIKLINESINEFNRLAQQELEKQIFN